MPDTKWDKTKKYSGTAYSKALKPGFDKAWQALDKLGAPVNKLSNRVGAEAFWPTTMDKESDKAARILRAFCKDGFYTSIDERQAEQAERSGEKVEGPRGKQRVVQKIPEKVMRQAKGLAIFTTMRTGLWVSGAGGSGVLVARNEVTGEWSPPSGILLHTAGLGFLVGVDIYDCVVVINTRKALEAFMKVRCTLGGEVSAVAGPVGIGGVLETELHKRQAPVYNYLKSRGFYAGVQIDGTVIIERTDENERFYGERIPVADILAGKAKRPPNDKIKMLMDTIHAAQGDKVDESALPDAPAPSDMEIESEGSTFGIPSSEDPDPYGVKALESEGLHIREAGTKSRPSQDAFEFKPAATSPIYATFRRSMDSPLARGRAQSWRGSMHSMTSIDKGTQTDEDESPSPRRHSPGVVGERKRKSTTASPEKITQHVNDDSDEAVDGPARRASHGPYRDNMEPSSSPPEDEDEDVDIQEAVPVISKARVVQIPKRVPPNLPPRNPGRLSSPLSETHPQIESLSRLDLDGDEGETPRAEVSEPTAHAIHAPSLVSDETSKNGEEQNWTSDEPAYEEVQLKQPSSSTSTPTTNEGEQQAWPDVDGKSTTVNGDSAPGKDDEFHSVPVTPIDKEIPGAFH